MPTILVTTPTGHIGARVVSQLLGAGATVRVFVRDPERLDAAVRGRVDARTGTLEDAAALTDALRGVDAAFFSSRLIRMPTTGGPSSAASVA